MLYNYIPTPITMSNQKLKYNEVLKEFVEDVRQRLSHARQFKKELGFPSDFRGKLYSGAVHGSDLEAFEQSYPSCWSCGWTEIHPDSHVESGMWGGCKYISDMYNVWSNDDGDVFWKRKPNEVHKLYYDMRRYESFDAFLTEHIKNSICEDNLGDILSFL